MRRRQVFCGGGGFLGVSGIGSVAAAGLVVGDGGNQRSRRRQVFRWRRQRLCGGGGSCHRRRQSKITTAAGFLSAAAKDHVDVDLGDVYVGDVELDEDLDIVIQLDVNVWVDDVRLDVVQIG
jgi:hypothetical protein